MKRFVRSMVLLLSVVASGCACAQTPAGASGQCKDGSYTSAAKKWQACAGHKGVQTWYAEAKASMHNADAASSAATTASDGTTQPGAAAKTTAAAPPASSAVAKNGPTAARTTAAPGGGPGMVWVNTATKVYHCPGGTFYGKTKDGKYMSEADAKSSGARPDRGRACTK